MRDLERRFRDAVASAEQQPKPPLASMFDDVYAEPSWTLKEQREELLTGPRAPEH
jgi:2-oxoisovalerate dehydrogenase E1 component alpha subunit